jgi:hypothetical protein
VDLRGGDSGRHKNGRTQCLQRRRHATGQDLTRDIDLQRDDNAMPGLGHRLPVRTQLTALGVLEHGLQKLGGVRVRGPQRVKSKHRKAQTLLFAALQVLLLLPYDGLLHGVKPLSNSGGPLRDDVWNGNVKRMCAASPSSEKDVRWAFVGLLQQQARLQRDSCYRLAELKGEALREAVMPDGWLTTFLAAQSVIGVHVEGGRAAHCRARAGVHLWYAVS